MSLQTRTNNVIDLASRRSPAAARKIVADRVADEARELDRSTSEIPLAITGVVACERTAANDPLTLFDPVKMIVLESRAAAERLLAPIR